MSMGAFDIRTLGVVGVLLNIAFLALSSQLLFCHIGPRSLSSNEARTFNCLTLFSLYGYFRSCRGDPGYVPCSWRKMVDEDVYPKSAAHPRWCKICEASKPPRAHHCKTCNRCVAKMDHHCPWTLNCVGHKTMAHFIRFLFYGVVALTELSYFLSIRVLYLWEYRNFSSHLGPSPTQLAHLLILVSVGFVTVFTMSLLLIRTIYCIAINATAIETWEMERHEALLKRARRNGGLIHGPNGGQILLESHEFPYDIGIWENLVRAMGSRNILKWFWPFSRSLRIETGLIFKTNGFLDSHLGWPPPDPDRYVLPRPIPGSEAEIQGGSFTRADVEAFRERQRKDLERFQQNPNAKLSLRVPNDLMSSEAEYLKESSDDESSDDGVATTSSRDKSFVWLNSEGERLEDFGVEDDEIFYEELNKPVSNPH